MLLGGILVLNAVWMLSTNVLQCGLSTQIRSPSESSMYTCPRQRLKSALRAARSCLPRAA